MPLYLPMGGSIPHYNSHGQEFVFLFHLDSRDSRGLLMVAVINQCRTGSGLDVGWAYREFSVERIRFVILVVV